MSAGTETRSPRGRASRRRRHGGRAALLLTVPLLALGGGCASNPARGASPGEGVGVCVERLPTRSTTRLTSVAALPAVPTPLSRIVVDADIDVAAALAEAERAVPRELGNGPDGDTVSVGDAGQLTMHVRRGDFALALAEREGKTQVGVRVPLVGDATLCRPLGPLGCVQVAACQPEALASASLVPLLDESYHFPPPEVAISLSRGCTLTAFQFDITPRLQAEANAQAERLRSRIEAALPEVREPLVALWELLGTTLPLGRGTCARLTPVTVIQTGARVADGHLRGGVGVEAHIRLESPCGASRRPGTLPAPVVRAPVDGEGSVDLQVPITLPWDEVTRATAESLSSIEASARGRRVHVTDASLEAEADGQATVRTVLAGPVCGTVLAQGTLRWQPERNAIGLSDVRITAEERTITGLSVVEADRLARQIEATLRVPLPVDITSLGSSVRKTVDALMPKPDSGKTGKTTSAEASLPMLDATLDEARVSLLRPTREGLTAVVQAPGQITAKLGAGR